MDSQMTDVGWMADVWMKRLDGRLGGQRYEFSKLFLHQSLLDAVWLKGSVPSNSVSTGGLCMYVCMYLKIASGAFNYLTERRCLTLCPEGEVAMFRTGGPVGGLGGHCNGKVGGGRPGRIGLGDD